MKYLWHSNRVVFKEGHCQARKEVIKEVSEKEMLCRVEELEFHNKPILSPPFNKSSSGIALNRASSCLATGIPS